MIRLPRAKPTTWIFALGVLLVHLASALPLQGPLHADELYQYLETPFRALHGYGFRVWEFDRGTRNWLLPGCILGILRACEAMRVSDPLQQLLAVRLAEKLLFLWGLWNLVRACDLLAGRRAAWLCALSVGLLPLLVLATSHPLSEPFSMSLVMLATLPAARFTRQPLLRHLALCGALLGLATVVRLQTGVLIPAFAAFALAQPGPRLRALALLGGAGVTLALGGLLDLWTYGEFAHSAIANLNAHFENGAALQTQMGTQPATFYATEALRHLGPLALLLLAAALWTFWRQGADLFALPALVLLGVHAAVPHKELRFLLPALPLLLAALCLAVDEFWRRRWLPVGAALLWLASAQPSWRALGTAPSTGTIQAARFLSAKAELRDWCTVGTGCFGGAGYFFLRRDVPFHEFASFPHIVAARAKDPGVCDYVTTTTIGVLPPPPGAYVRVAHFDGADVFATPEAAKAP